MEQRLVTRDGEQKSSIGSTRSKLVVNAGFCSERGRRANNEDFAATIFKASAKTIVVAAISDGVGGAKGGRVAAELAVRGFIEGSVGQIEYKSPKEAALH